MIRWMKTDMWHWFPYGGEANPSLWKTSVLLTDVRLYTGRSMLQYSVIKSKKFIYAPTAMKFGIVWRSISKHALDPRNWSVLTGRNRRQQIQLARNLLWCILQIGFQTILIWFWFRRRALFCPQKICRTGLPVMKRVSTTACFPSSGRRDLCGSKAAIQPKQSIMIFTAAPGGRNLMAILWKTEQCM